MSVPAIVDNSTQDASFWLEAANAAVRDYCGWHITPVITETFTLDGSGTQEMLLPSGRVKTITAVTNDGTDVLASVEYSQKGMLRLSTGWTRKYRGVVVTLEHGYASAAAVAGVVAALAARSAAAPAGGLITSQGIGPATVRYAAAPMLKEEMAALGPYRLTWTP